MKSTYFKSIIFLFIVFSSLTLNQLTSEKRNVIDHKKSFVIPDEHLGIYNSFIEYNPKMDSTTIDNIYSVLSKLKIIENEVTLKYLIAQILLESGGNHTINGEVLTSYSGALGICQITPMTAYDYFNRILSNHDLILLEEFGATDFKSILFEDITKESRIKLTSEWLKIKKNNIILWGFIMKHNMKLGLMDALVTYNSGFGGYISYSNSGKLLSEHSYIVSIRERLTNIDLIFKRGV
jgi:hypothetical protein